MEFVIKWTMPRLFLVSLVRVCTRIRTPRIPLADVVILSISARFVPRNIARRHNVVRWSASPQRCELGQHAFENDAPKKLPVYFQRVPFRKRFEQFSTHPRTTLLQKQKTPFYLNLSILEWCPFKEIHRALYSPGRLFCRLKYRIGKADLGMKRVLPERRYLTSVVDNEFRLLRVRRAVHEYCKLERAVLFGYEAWLASPSTRIKLSRLINLACPYGAACALSRSRSHSCSLLPVRGQPLRGGDDATVM